MWWSNVETHVVYFSQINWMIDRRRQHSNFYMNTEHGWMNSFIKVPYNFQALRKYSLEDFNSVLLLYPNIEWGEGGYLAKEKSLFSQD